MREFEALVAAMRDYAQHWMPGWRYVEPGKDD
jgi:hypothetical protein